MLRAYFDESGHASNTNVVAIGGFMATAEEWSAFNERWRDVLRKHGLAEFHAAKISRHHGACKGWSQNQVDSLMSDAVAAIAVGDLIGIAYAVIVADYNQIVGSNRWFARKFGSVYRLCYESCIQAAFSWMKQNPRCANESLTIVFASNAEFGGAALLEGERYVAHPQYEKRIESVTSAAARDVPALQAADLLAYETFKYCQQYFTTGKDTPRVSYRRFFEEIAMALPKYWDAEGLAYLCLTIAHGEPGLAPMERVALTRYLLQFNKPDSPA